MRRQTFSCSGLMAILQILWEQGVTELAMDAVKNMGGIVENVVLQRRFKYFPHVNSQDMNEGFYDKVESQLQVEWSTCIKTS
ncbi:hypothetical protein LOK49_LG14G01863 [Camellia lanceoleosa]|uniref:Uncharacterized protein n=1 Tax=Camellia lanceoleosa TaxID=1840588 RepID=A0ACC0FDV4_9ERIC|nr:hypothetical protein LOK49_LG14G01863 [Camellia lanceoleosa]